MTLEKPCQSPYCATLPTNLTYVPIINDQTHVFLQMILWERIIGGFMKTVKAKYFRSDWDLFQKIGLSTGPWVPGPVGSIRPVGPGGTCLIFFLWGDLIHKQPISMEIVRQRM